MQGISTLRSTDPERYARIMGPQFEGAFPGGSPHLPPNEMARRTAMDAELCTKMQAWLAQMAARRNSPNTK